MKKTILKTLVLIILMVISVVSCERNPMKRLSDPFDEGALNTWSGVFKIYDDDLITGGNVAFIPADLTPPDNNMTIDFKVTEENPPEGAKCLKYTWNGQNQVWGTKNEHDWAGVTLIAATHWSLYNSTPAKDLSPGGYTRITFKAFALIDRNTYVKFEGPISTTTTAPTKGGTRYLRLNSRDLENWQTYTINFSVNDFKSVKDYFKIVIEYPLAINKGPFENVGNGGMVYVDDIRYER
ncbi:MAG: hypothetical protein HY920_02490 [Elusimicrobia bacterium]|nr:hypothetical protein [Elusimicrobiota bacterium]